MLIIFGLCFAISTLGYYESDPAIISLKIVRYGFPMTWLKVTTALPPPPPTQYTVLWTELFVDIIFYLALSLVVSFIIIKAMGQREDLPKSSLWARFLFIILMAYSTKVLTCGIHELLGHGLWARIFGADTVEVYVSWLGFGWCRWQGIGESPIASIMAMAGGLINTFIIGVAILTFLFLVPKKGGLYLRSFLFWLGFWATTTQPSYLLLGFATNGDPWQLHLLTGIPLSFFVLLGFGLFLLIYPILSILFLSDTSKLFPEYPQKTLLFTLWLAIPIQVIFLMISPEHRMSFEMFLLLFAVSMIPSLLSLPLFKFFNRMYSNI
jgi:hypothetical protein